MEFKDLFEQFDKNGVLVLPNSKQPFHSIPWEDHPSFQGVALKHIVKAEQTGGRFSFHLVRIAPNCKIGLHTHETQLETHEVIAGNGICVQNGTRLFYCPGTISIFEKKTPHEVIAGPEGLYLFAKFLPPLI